MQIRHFKGFSQYGVSSVIQHLHGLRQQRAKDWRSRRTAEIMTEAAEAAACHDVQGLPTHQSNHPQSCS